MRCQTELMENVALKEEVNSLRGEIGVLKNELEASAPSGWWQALGEDNARLAEENTRLSLELEKLLKSIEATKEEGEEGEEGEEVAGDVEKRDTEKERKEPSDEDKAKEAYEAKRQERAKAMAEKLGLDKVFNV